MFNKWKTAIALFYWQELRCILNTNKVINCNTLYFVSNNKYAFKWENNFLDVCEFFQRLQTFLINSKAIFRWYKMCMYLQLRWNLKTHSQFNSSERFKTCEWGLANKMARNETWIGDLQIDAFKLLHRNGKKW